MSSLFLPSQGLWIPPSSNGGGSVQSEFWALPETPNDDDVEFLGTQLPSDFQCFSPTTGALATRQLVDPDMWAAPNQGEYRAKVGQQSSWLSLQAGSRVGGALEQQYFYYHPLQNPMSAVADYTWRIRVRGWVPTGAGAGDHWAAAQLALYGDSGGLPNANYFLRCGIGCAAGGPPTPRVEIWGFDGGLNNLQQTLAITDKIWNGDGEFALTHKAGLGWGAWWLPASGTASFLLGAFGGCWTGVSPASMAYVGIWFGGANAPIPARPVIRADYIRRQNQCSIL